MKRFRAFNPVLSLFLTALFLAALWASCKKDDEDKKTSGNVNIQVTLPAGSSVDLSKTEVYTLSKSYSVGSDGKSNILFNSNTYELAYLFDETNNLLLMGFISDDNKEISIASTAQALIYFGLGATVAIDGQARIEQIKKIPAYPQFAGFVTELSNKFVADPRMLVKGLHLEALVGATNAITNRPVLDLIGKQIKVEDADGSKSGLIVKPKSGDDENIEVENDCFRRGHAFLYKTAYKNASNTPFTLISEISGSTASTQDLEIKGRGKNKETELSGPVALPLESHEKEATWKVRIVGVGGDIYYKAASLTPPGLTSQESAKLEQLWKEFFAVDLLLPFMLDALGQRTTFGDDVRYNNIELVRPFINKTNEFTSQSNTIDEIKGGDYRGATVAFLNELAEKPYKWEELATILIADAQGKTGQYVQYEEDVQAEFAKAKGILEIIADATDPGSAVDGSGSTTNLTYLHNMFSEQLVVVHHNCNTLEEWTVISKDNDVTITPKHSKAIKFTNHTLTASATADLATGESIQYVWSTPGQFGVFKPSNATTTAPSTSTTVTYYGNNAPDEDNIETIYLTASITGPNGTRELGTDTAYVNVKSVSIVMKPNGATLTPKSGNSSVTLKLLNADDTNPIIQGNGVEYKVEWSTPGNYGHLDGNTKTYVTPHNSVVYTATDEDVKSATENITAKVYFKLSSSLDWIFREEVKGTVKINNDPKKITYYAPLTSYHDDRDDGAGNLWHYSNCGVAIAPVEDAISYSVTITLASGSTYSESWLATAPGWLRGYMYGIDPATTGTHYVGYGANWGSCVHNGCNHTIADCSGGQAFVTITVQ